MPFLTCISAGVQKTKSAWDLRFLHTREFYAKCEMIKFEYLYNTSNLFGFIFVFMFVEFRFQVITAFFTSVYRCCKSQILLILIFSFLISASTRPVAHTHLRKEHTYCSTAHYKSYWAPLLSSVSFSWGKMFGLINSQAYCCINSQAYCCNYNISITYGTLSIGYIVLA